MQIYLQNLPTAMTTFRSTTTSYFGASSMANAVTKALPSTTPSAFGVPIVPLSDTPTSAPVIVKRRSRSIIDGKELDNERCSLFSEEEVALLSRNAEDLLSLHDRFVVQLQDVVAPFGSLFSFGSKDDGNYLEFPTDDCLDRVIIAVMSQFAEQVYLRVTRAIPMKLTSTSLLVYFLRHLPVLLLDAHRSL